MSFEKSEVMGEFLKIASEQGLVSKAKDSEETIKSKRVEKSKEDIVEKAHPKPVFVAESRGEGGLVENLNETHKKIMEIINKMPTGSLVGRYASTSYNLLKLADECEKVGENDVSDELTKLASKFIGAVDFSSPLE